MSPNGPLASPIGCPVTHHSVPISTPPEPRSTAQVDLDEAIEFIEQFYAENPDTGDAAQRSRQVRASVLTTGSYWHTAAELAWGARVAWRNNARCIGRLYWNSLHIRDLRSVRDADDIATHCRMHLQIAANAGKIRPVVSIFAPEEPDRPAPQIWNDQLIRYAGYRRADGSVLGDPRYVGFTEAVTELGWRSPARPGAFDVLPLVIETPENGPRLYSLDSGDVLEVPLSHPEFAWFAELGLRWHAVPAISNMRLRVGGIDYPAAPFNGWYMGTEIGARNLVDRDRYDLTEPVAERLGLDMSSEQTLWRDRAVIEINRAVLHSFGAAGVTITDHHTESQRFLTHVDKEQRAGRSCPADWSWIVPPVSGGLTPVFHRYYDDEVSGPQFVLSPEAAARGVGGRTVRPTTGRDNVCRPVAAVPETNGHRSPAPGAASYPS
jgi:nitric-oxide synthase